MAPHLLRAFAFGLIVTLGACGSEGPAGSGGPSQQSLSQPGPSQAGASLPAYGPSWISGTGTMPVDGRLVVGLLIPQRAPRRLASLVPPAKLAAYLDGGLREDEEIRESWPYPGRAYRVWGKEASVLAALRELFRQDHGVDVEFREVLAEECGALPLVFVGRKPLVRHERVTLKAYRDRGGRVLRLRARRLAGGTVSVAAMATTAIESAYRDSTLVHRLPRSPFRVEAHRDGDAILVRCPLGAERVTLEDPSGTTLAAATAAPGVPARLHAPDPELDPFTHNVVVTWRGEGVELRRAWAVVDLVGTVERELFASDHVVAGGVMALRVRTSLSHDGSVVGAQKGRVALVRDGLVLAQARYETDAHGYAHPRLALGPDTTPGKATLQFDGLERAIAIASGVRVSVVTDRPLYKQTDVVHVRAMVHRSGDGRPVAGAKIQLSLGDAKRFVTTSKHGIASHTFQLTDARVGGALVMGVLEGATARCAIRVKAFERPTFTLASDPAELVLRAGETAPLTFHARYVNGTPVIGAKVTVDVRGRLKTSNVPSHTATDGSVRVDVVTAPGRGASLVILRVQDVDGRLSELTVPVRMQREGIRMGIVALSDLVVGVPARFEITASEPGRYELQGASGGARTLEIDDTGRTVVTLAPDTEDVTLRLVAVGDASAFSRTFHVTVPGRERLVLALDRRTVRVGETLALTLVGPEGGVRIDIWKGATAVWTKTARLTTGRTTLQIPIDARMAGVLRVHASTLGSDPQFEWATVLATRGRALQVRARSAAAAYAPGATARVDVTVRDADGEPTSAVLGYWGVDEALLALAPMTVGHERVFDVLGADTASRAYALADRTDRAQAIPRADVEGAFGAKKGRRDAQRTFPIHLRRTPNLRRAARDAIVLRNREHLQTLRKAYLDAWKGIPLTELVRSDSLRETAGWLVARGALDVALLRDAWGTPYALWTDPGNLEIIWRSAGPDRRFATADDLSERWLGYFLYEEMPARIRSFHAFVRAHYDPSLDDEDTEVDIEEETEEDTEEVHEQEIVAEEPVIKDEEIFDSPETDNDLPFEESFGGSEGLPGAAFEGPMNNGTIGIGGGAGGAFAARGGGRDLGTGAGGSKYFTPRPQYVRKDFDPTLCFVPQAIVGPDGRTMLSIPLKDSITTWRLRLVASNAEGAVGVGQGSLRVRQPIHASPWLAPHLTVGDFVDVPVAVRNEEPHAVTVRVTAVASAQLENRAERTVALEVGPGATGRVTFRYHAREPGKARVRIEVDTGAARDLQERVVQVHPFARTVVDVLSGSVSGSAAFPTVMAAAGPGEVRMDLYPSPLAEIVSGFDGLIRAPHG